MILYCKEIIDHRIGDNTPSEKIAKSFGWEVTIEEENVERAYDGTFWEKGFAPQKPQSLINQERISELKEKLAEYDYIGVKIATGCATIEDYADKIAQCEEWRAEINRLEEEDHAENENSENSDSEPLGILGL